MSGLARSLPDLPLRCISMGSCYRPGCSGWPLQRDDLLCNRSQHTAQACSATPDLEGAPAVLRSQHLQLSRILGLFECVALKLPRLAAIPQLFKKSFCLPMKAFALAHSNSPLIVLRCSPGPVIGQFGPHRCDPIILIG